jgi:protein SCO1/2
MPRRLSMIPLVLTLAFAGSFLALRVRASPDCPHDHAAHRKVVEQDTMRYDRSTQSYRIPDVTLTNQQGAEVALPALLHSSEPVALNFIFTTCGTICPVMTSTFSQMQKALGADASGLRLVSISIDPEHDTPRVLRAYAKRFGANGGWQFLTGTAEQIVQTQKAFDAYTGSKINHRPLTFFSTPDAEKWLRIDGLASGADLATEYRRLHGE